MRQVDRELDRYVTLLRNMIRQRGFTQMEVQDALGWGRSYISQIVTQQKKLRMDQVLRILNVIGVPPGEFFGELYRGASPTATARRPLLPREAAAVAPIREEMKRVYTLLRALVKVLLDKRVITSRDLRAAEQEAGE